MHAITSYNPWKLVTLSKETRCNSCYENITPQEQAADHSTKKCLYVFHLKCLIKSWADKNTPSIILEKNLDNQWIRVAKGELCGAKYILPDPFFRKIQPLLLWERNKLHYTLLTLFTASIMAVALSGSFLFLRSKITVLPYSEITKKAFLSVSVMSSGGLSYLTTKTIYQAFLDYLVKS